MNDFWWVLIGVACVFGGIAGIGAFMHWFLKD